MDDLLTPPTALDPFPLASGPPPTISDPLVSSNPEILVEQPEESDVEMEGASSVEADPDFSTDFLRAKTNSFRQEALHPTDQPDWEQYVVASAADIESKTAAGPMSTDSLEIGAEISDICAYLIGVFSDMEKYTKFLSYRGEAAQDLLDLLQKLLDLDAPLAPYFRSILYVALVRLCRKSELYPRCFSLTGVDADFGNLPLFGGKFGDVYKGYYEGKPICLKVLRVYQGTTRSEASLLNKSFSREAVVWGQLSHPNILPFLGVHRRSDVHGSICLISLWMENGNIIDYSKSQPEADRPTLIHDIAAGMEYLHTNGVVHGDIKGLNILVTDSGRACLTDFGFSYVSDATGLKGPALSSNPAEGGTVGFQAPELVDTTVEAPRRTKASDVYAFGMVCYELLADKRPFGKARPPIVISRIKNGQHPERPREEKPGLTDTMWTLMTQCWSILPAGRPTATEILQGLPQIEKKATHDDSWAHTRRLAFDTSGGRPDVTITNALSHLRSI